MSLKGNSFLGFEGLSQSTISSIFNRTRSYKEGFSVQADHCVIALIFEEPSTRTALSFDLAAARLGIRALKLESISSSMQKGETFYDSILTAESMGFDALVIRHKTDELLRSIAGEISTPIVSAGEGKKSHPTQALLDGYTIFENRGKISGEKVLFVGDVVHSRVARSNFDLLKKFSAEIGVCGPSPFINGIDDSQIKKFDNLQDGLEWANVCMALRVQSERHVSEMNEVVMDYVENYRLTKERLRAFSNNGIIMHPGPVLRGVEMTSEVLMDKRCKVLEQVKNGVLVRAALLSEIIGI